MVWLRMSIFMVIVGALSGAISYAMTYTETDWFHGEQNRMELNITQPTQEQIDALSPSESDIADGGAMHSFSMLSFIWSSFKGILIIPAELGKWFYVDSPFNPGENLFAPFLWLIQIGIWIVYVLGLYQFFTKQQIGYSNF